MIASAAESILKLQMGIRLITARNSKNIGSPRRLGSETEDTKVHAACIICYKEILDVVFMPRNHLAVCTVSLDSPGLNKD